MSDLPTIQIRLKQSMEKHRPAGGPARFFVDRLVSIVQVDWPGKPHRDGTIGSFSGKPHDHWAFWDDWGIDEAFIFGPEDVAEAIVPDVPACRDAFAGAPFPVTWVAPRVPVGAAA